MRYYSKFNRGPRLIAAAALTVGCLVFTGIQVFANIQADDELDKKLSMSYCTITDEEYEEEAKKTDSDIKGMSQYDKIQKGLMVSDGSDSDFDGLSDKDEIEKYGTDPLKASTSGDLYTDGYKVEHKMKLTKKYNYKGEVSFSNNKCKEVKLTADDPLDMSAVVTDVSKASVQADVDASVAYKIYKLYNYSGSLSIDRKKALPNDIDPGDIQIKVFKGAFINETLGEFEDVEFNIEGNDLVLQYQFEVGERYYIVLAKKETIGSLITSAFGGEADDETNETGVGLMVTSPLLGNFSRFESFTDFMYSEMSNPDTTKAFRDRFIKKLNKTIFGSYDEDVVTINSENLTAQSKSSILTRYNLLKTFLKPFELTSEGQKWYQLFFTFTYYDYESGKVTSDYNGLGRNGNKDDVKNFKKYHTDFDQYIDEFCFQNFGSEIAPGGNCLGITHFASYLYNTGKYPAKGSYNKISWDLSKDDENKTLTDPGIYDYKNIRFVDDHVDGDNKLIEDKLTKGEKEFVKMIGAGWKEGNDIIYHPDYIKTNGELNDYSLLQKMMAYIDDGKVINVCLHMNDGGGHAIILYDYFWTDDESVSFRVYDCNLPQNDMDKTILSESNGACYFRCNIVTRPNGKKEFEYLYYPLDQNKGYMAASSGFLMDKSYIVVTDENFNIFNKKNKNRK